MKGFFIALPAAHLIPFAEPLMSENGSSWTEQYCVLQQECSFRHENKSQHRSLIKGFFTDLKSFNCRDNDDAPHLCRSGSSFVTTLTHDSYWTVLALALAPSRALASECLATS